MLFALDVSGDPDYVSAFINFYDGGSYHIDTIPYHFLCKSMDWFLYARSLRHERVKRYIYNNQYIY